MLGFSELLGWALKSTGCDDELFEWTELKKETLVGSVKLAVMVSAMGSWQKSTVLLWFILGSDDRFFYLTVVLILVRGQTTCAIMDNYSLPSLLEIERGRREITSIFIIPRSSFLSYHLTSSPYIFIHKVFFRDCARVKFSVYLFSNACFLSNIFFVLQGFLWDIIIKLNSVYTCLWIVSINEILVINLYF